MRNSTKHVRMKVILSNLNCSYNKCIIFHLGILPLVAERSENELLESNFHSRFPRQHMLLERQFTRI